jgi:hypothetical protein
MSAQVPKVGLQREHLRWCLGEGQFPELGFWRGHFRVQRAAKVVLGLLLWGCPGAFVCMSCLSH